MPHFYTRGRNHIKTWQHHFGQVLYFWFVFAAVMYKKTVITLCKSLNQGAEYKCQHLMLTVNCTAKALSHCVSRCTRMTKDVNPYSINPTFKLQIKLFQIYMLVSYQRGPLTSLSLQHYREKAAKTTTYCTQLCCNLLCCHSSLPVAWKET